MGVTIGAEGYIGIALEDTPSDYEAPTKFFPIRSESLRWVQNTNQRRVIRGTADVIGAIAGNGNVEGTIDSELLSDVLPYMLRCARGELTKTGASAPFEYEFTPAHGALAPKTMSITVVRGEEAFGYVGCVVSAMNFSVDNDMAVVEYNILGTTEQDVAVPAAPTYVDDIPFGAGDWNIQIPVGTQVFDCDNLSFEVDDGGEVQFRLKNELGAQFISFGERNVSISVDRDFVDRSEYDTFKALTSKSIRVLLDGGLASNKVQLDMPVAFVEDYDIPLSGVGDLVRGSTTYFGAHHGATGGAWACTVTTNEDVTIT